MNCKHEPTCPGVDAVDHDAAKIVASHPEQGWNQLCNGVIVFDDTGELLPGGVSVAPHRGPAPHSLGFDPKASHVGTTVPSLGHAA